MATIKERTGKNGRTFLIRVSCGYGINGRQIEKTMTWKPSPGMTDRQIDKALKEATVIFERKVKDGIILDSTIKFADFAQKWMDEYAKKQIAPKTRERYKSLLVRINQAIGNIRMDKLRPHHLQALYSNLGEEGIKVGSNKAIASVDLSQLIKSNNITRNDLAKLAGLSATTIAAAFQNKKIALESGQAIARALNMNFKKVFKIEQGNSSLSDKTILHHHRLISSILQTAVQWQVIYDNPAKRVKPPKVERKEAKYLEDTEAHVLMDCLADEHIKWQTMVILLLYSGMRRGELCGLEWNDIDFNNNIIHIQRASQYVSGMGIIEKGTKNFSSQRVLKLPEEVFVLLSKFKSWQNQEILKLGDRWQGQIPVKDSEGKITMRKNHRIFTQEDGLPIHPDSVTDWVRKFRKKYNLPEFSPHTLRHTNISLMIAAGVPMRNISQRAGHAQLSTTQNIYAHAIKTADEIASESIGNILNPRERIIG